MKLTHNTWTTIGLVLVVAILVGAGIVWWGNKDDMESDTSSSTSESSQSTSSASVEPTHDPEAASCTTNQLTITETADPNGSSAGHTYTDLIFKNTSQQACNISGYPSVSLINDNDAQIGKLADKDTSVATKNITLSPGGQVKSVLTIGNPDNMEPGACSSGVTQIKVFPPDQGESANVPTSITAWCPGFTTTVVATF